MRCASAAAQVRVAGDAPPLRRAPLPVRLPSFSVSALPVSAVEPLDRAALPICPVLMLVVAAVAGSSRAVTGYGVTNFVTSATNLVTLKKKSRAFPRGAGSAAGSPQAAKPSKAAKILGVLVAVVARRGPSARTGPEFYLALKNSKSLGAVTSVTNLVTLKKNSPRVFLAGIFRSSSGLA